MLNVMTFLIVLLPIAFIGLAVPWFGHSRRGILFGVTVTLDFANSPEARAALRRYRRDAELLAMAVLLFATVTLWLGHAHDWAVLAATLIAIPAELIGTLLLWNREHHRMLAHAARVPLERSAELAPVSHIAPILAATAALLPLAAEAVWLHLHWDLLPVSWPDHWNASGMPNNWATRSAGGVFAPLLTGALVVALMAALSAFLGSASGTQPRQRGRALAPLATLAWVMSALFCLVGLLPVLQPIKPATFVSAVFLQVIVVFAVVVWLLWRTRIADSAPASEPYDGTPDSMWHAGLFYYNPADAAVIVPKRFGWGWTLNFARPASWLYVVSILVAVGLIVCVPLLTLQ